jgi:SAM-dependent methyltransferase
MESEPFNDSESRWKAAQTYEAGWWRAYEGSFNTDQLKQLAKLVTDKISPFYKIDRNTRILEVGPGPIGIVPFMTGDKKVALDPLHHTYEGIETYSKLRQSAIENGTEYVYGKGECTNYENNSFDLYITDNVLDHVDNHKAFISEIHRVLKIGGIAYIGVHVYHGWGRCLRYLMEFFVIDKGHPYTFSSKSLSKLFLNNGFRILSTERSSYWQSWKKDCRRALNGDLKAMIQVLFLITRADYEIIVQKP